VLRLIGTRAEEVEGEIWGPGNVWREVSDGREGIDVIVLGLLVSVAGSLLRGLGACT
jgi:hypothetical protein